MLILTGMCVEVTGSGNRSMLLLSSPRAPGVHYKVETDPATVQRLKAVIESEVAVGVLSDTDDEEEKRRGEGYRF